MCFIRVCKASFRRRVSAPLILCESELGAVGVCSFFHFLCGPHTQPHAQVSGPSCCCSCFATCTSTSCSYIHSIVTTTLYSWFYILHARIARWLPHYQLHLCVARGSLVGLLHGLPQRPHVMASPPGTFSCSTLTCASRLSTSPLLALPARLDFPLDLFTTSRFFVWIHCLYIG